MKLIKTIFIICLMMTFFAGCSIVESNIQQQFEEQDENIEYYVDLSFLDEEKASFLENNELIINNILYNSPSLYDIYADDGVEVVRINDIEHWVFSVPSYLFEESMKKLMSEEIYNSKFKYVSDYEGNLSVIIADGGFSIPDKKIYKLVNCNEEYFEIVIEGLYWNTKSEENNNFDEDITEMKKSCDYIIQHTLEISKEEGYWKIVALEKN